MKSLFQAIGYQVGRGAAKAKNIYDLVGGDDAESLRAEMRLGDELAQAALANRPLIRPNETTQYARDIGQWLASYLTERRLRYTFHFTAEPALNAFALPGGHVFVSWPLLELCADRDEIAFLLGHEMAHINLRHALDRVVQDSVFALLLRRSPGSAATAWLQKVGQQALSRAYSREQEFEADAFALGLLDQGGGNLEAGENLLGKLAAQLPQQAKSNWSEYLATHPPLDARVQYLRTTRTAWNAKG